MNMKIELSYTKFQHGGQTNLGIWLIIHMPDGPFAFQVPEYMTDVADVPHFWMMTTEVQAGIVRLMSRLGHTVEPAIIKTNDIYKAYTK